MSYPMRNDTKPRAVWPAGLTHLEAIRPLDPLTVRSAKLWPEEEAHYAHNRQEWVRAVNVARKSSKGWLADVVKP